MHNLRFSIFFFIAALFFFASCNKEPVASFEFDQNNVRPPVTINFTNTSINAEEYLWNFGDGVTSTETNPSHEYTKGGDYDVSLKAYGENDTHTIVQTISILPNMTGHWNVTFILGDMNLQGRMNLEEMASHKLTGEFALTDQDYMPINADSNIDGFDVEIGVTMNRFWEIDFKGTVNSSYDSMSGQFDFRGSPGGPWSATKGK